MKNISLFALALLLVSSSFAQNESQDIPDIKSIENALIESIQIKGEPVQKFNIQDRMKLYNVPGVSIAVVQNGKIKWAKGYGYANTTTGTKVDVNTLFQAGSISKPVAALSALKLVEEGRLDLDQNVNMYLKDWQIPDTDFTKEEKVTLRRLLTHTAGTTVHGFPGYKQSDTFPTIIEVLSGKGNTPNVFVDTIPGTNWRYSGGGYTIMEKVVEDVSGLSLEDYMAKNILKPIGMTNSTYDQPIGKVYHKNTSAAYDYEGTIITGLWHNYPEQAAAGLWTTPTDLAKYCIEIQEIRKGKDDGVLSKTSIDNMLTKHKGDWGLGPALTWENDSLVFRHGGKNAGFTNNLISFANRGDAVIVMTNADNGGKLMTELINAVSSHYDWGISNPTIVETIELSAGQLNAFIGTYQLDYQVPGIGDYIIEISIKDNYLYVDDPNDENVMLTPLEDFKFMNLQNGDVAVFQLDEDKQGLLWNNRFQFDRIKN